MTGGTARISATGLRICISGIVLLAGLAAVVRPAEAVVAAPAWTMGRFDTANSGFNPAERYLSRANVASLAEDWKAPAALYASPLVAGGVVYVGCEPHSFCALDSTNGAVRWKTPIGLYGAKGAAALVGDVLYVAGLRPASEYALNARTGEVIWKTLVSNVADDFATALTVSDGVVVQGVEGFLFGWDAATGIQKWVVRLNGRGKPAVAGGVVYVQADLTAPTLYAVRLATGEIIWRSPPTAGYAGATPVVTNGLVVVATHGIWTDTEGLVSAFPVAGCGAAVCSPVWTYDGGRTPTAAPAAANGVVYQGFANGYYVALEATTGRLLWKGLTRGASDPTTSGTRSPTVVSDLLLGTDGDGWLEAWPAAGCGAQVCQALWSASISLSEELAVVSGRLYWIDSIRVLHVFSPRENPPPVTTPPPPTDPGPPPAPNPSTTLYVPRDHLSIQRAIDASKPGDVVVVAPGVYHERLDFHGHAVEVRSAGGPDVTTIDGDWVSTVVLFESGESRSSALRGFTITHGGGYGQGGAISAAGTSPTIADNVIAHNVGMSGVGIHAGGGPLIENNEIRDNRPEPGSSGGSGGGISLSANGAVVRGNLVEDNDGGSDGGGMALWGVGSATIVDNIIRRNSARHTGGGIAVRGGPDVLLVQNVIVENSSGDVGGGVDVWDDKPTLVANTIAGNTAPKGSALFVGYSDAGMTVAGNVLTGPADVTAIECDHTYTAVIPTFTNNLVHGGPAVGCGSVGWTAADPRLVSPAEGDYRLASGSPAIDAGGDTPAPRPSTDINGAPRVVDGDGDGVARVDIGAYEAQPARPAGVSGDGFNALPPARILDTRSGAALGPGGTVDLQVTGRGGVPASGVTAVVMNLTVTEPSATSFLTAWPAGVTRPLASNLNYVPGQTVPNLITVKVGEGGKVSLYNYAGFAHVIVDVAGWYGAEGFRYTPVEPSRILDTRAGVGGPAAAVGPALTLSLQVSGKGGVPAAGVSAVVLNVTVTQPTATSFLTAWPAGAVRPLASNLNYVPGQTVPNLVVVKVGDGGQVNLYNHAGTAHVIADVAGWFGDGAQSTFTALAPARLLDTRKAYKPGPASTLDLQVSGRGGVPAIGVSAVVLNVTVTEPTATSFLTAWPAGSAQPLASNLNYVAGLTVPNLVVVKVGDGGKVGLYNYAGWAHVIVDVAGWYA